MEHWCLVPIESLTFTSHTWNNFHLDTLLLQKIHFLPTPAKHLQIPNKKRHKTSTSIHHTSHDKLTYKLLHQHNHTKTIPTKTHQWITPFKSHNSCPSFCKTQKKLMYFLLPQSTIKKTHFIKHQDLKTTQHLQNKDHTSKGDSKAFAIPQYLKKLQTKL